MLTLVPLRWASPASFAPGLSPGRFQPSGEGSTAWAAGKALQALGAQDQLPAASRHGQHQVGGSLGMGDGAGCHASATTEEHLLMWAICDFGCGLNSVPRVSILTAASPLPQPPALAMNAALLGNRVFADTVQLNEVTLGWGP